MALQKEVRHDFDPCLSNCQTISGPCCYRSNINYQDDSILPQSLFNTIQFLHAMPGGTYQGLCEATKITGIVPIIVLKGVYTNNLLCCWLMDLNNRNRLHYVTLCGQSFVSPCRHARLTLFWLLGWFPTRREPFFCVSFPLNKPIFQFYSVAQDQFKFESALIFNANWVS